MSSSAPIDFVRILALLSEAGADFVVIGGLALQLHGGDNLTYDADFALIRRRENAILIAQVLAPYQPRPRDWPPGLPFDWDAQTIMGSTTLTLETDLGFIDFLAEPAGSPPYPELKARAVTFQLGQSTIYVACIEDLIAMKRAAGRPKDLGHIAELESILRLLGEDRHL